MASNPAPGELEQVRAFINTWDADEDAEHLPGPRELRDWLVEQDLLAPSDDVTAADHRHALEVREALRAVLLANSALDLDPGAGPVLDDAAVRARLGVRFVADAQDEGTWPRLKACLADDCQWAFYDLSRNRSAVWCDMKVCGNRQKVRSYRERHHRPH